MKSVGSRSRGRLWSPGEPGVKHDEEQTSSAAPWVLPGRCTQSTAPTARSSLPDSLLAQISQGVFLSLPLTPPKAGREQRLPCRQRRASGGHAELTHSPSIYSASRDFPGER